MIKTSSDFPAKVKKGKKRVLMSHPELADTLAGTVHM